MEATNKRLTSEDLDKLAKKHITLNRQINSSPNQFLSKMIKQSKIELNAEMTVEEIKQILTDIKVEINYEGYTYNLAFEPNDDELKIKESGSATGREVYYHWETVKDIVHNIKQEKVFHSPVGNETAEEVVDFTDCIDILKGRMSISGYLLGKMEKWDYSDDKENLIYDDWVENYSSKVSAIFNPDYTHYGDIERPYVNKKFYDYYLANKDSVLNEVFRFVYNEAREHGNEVRKILADEIMIGSGFEQGKFRIEEKYAENGNDALFVTFLKKEYGVGGRSGEGIMQNHDGRGIEIVIENKKKYNFKWTEVAKAIAAAIDNGTYITKSDIEMGIRTANRYISERESYPEGFIKKAEAFLAKYDTNYSNISHSPVGNEVHKAKEPKPKQEQTTVQKGQTTMNNNVIIGTIDYKAIKEKKYININSADECKRVADTLVENGVPFSGRIQPNLQKGTITVSPENYKAVIDILAKVKANSPVEKKNTTIGNKPYKYIYDKKYINSNEEEIRKLAEILTREGFEFSGNIYNADKAAITVSGPENQKLAQAWLNYIRNTTIVNHIADYDFTLVDVQTLTVKDKNDNTMRFENYEQMENAFNDIENEFFHPTYYQLGLTSDAFNGVYAVQAMDSTTGKEKGELTKRISTLNNLKSDWNAARYKMQDAIKDAPRKISICEKALSLYEQDKATVMSVPKVTVGDKEGYPITINGKEYTDRAEGGKVLAHMIDSNMSGLHSGEVVEIGKYRGMTINAIATALWDSDSKEIKLEVVGAKRYYTTAVNMESNRYEGNLLRIDNVLDKFDNLIADVKNDITNIKKSIVDAEVSINAPFEYESELIEKTARLEAVNAELLAADNETNTCLAIYETLSFIVPEIENPEIINDNEFIRYFVSDKNKRPFVIEALGNGEFFASREDKKNGDVMTCGGITFKLNAEEKSIELTSYRDDYKGIYEEYSNENPASLNILKNCLEELNKIDDSNYAQVNSNAFHEKLDLSDDEQTYYAQSFDEAIKTANKIEDALDSGLLDKNEQSRGRE